MGITMKYMLLMLFLVNKIRVWYTLKYNAKPKIFIWRIKRNCSLQQARICFIMYWCHIFGRCKEGYKYIGMFSINWFLCIITIIIYCYNIISGRNSVFSLTIFLRSIFLISKCFTKWYWERIPSVLFLSLIKVSFFFNFS